MRLHFFRLTMLFAMSSAILFFLSPVQSIFAASITVNATCSLSDAITSANTDTATGGFADGSGIFCRNILCISFFC